MDNGKKEVIQRHLQSALIMTSSEDLCAETIQIVALLEECPAYLDGWVELVKIKIKCANSLLEIEQLVSTALGHHPNNIELLMQLGEARRSWGELDRAFECYQQVVKLQPCCVDPQLKMVEILVDLRRLDEAIALLRNLLDIYPENYTVLTKLGRLERARGNRECALELFQVAIGKTTSPAQKMNASLLATEELRSLNRLDEALEIIEPILERWPKNTWAKMTFGNLLMRKQEFSEASKVFQEILQLSPDDINAYAKLAQSLRNSGKRDDAINLLQQTPAHVYHHHQIQKNLGILYRDKNDRKQAIECFQKAFDAVPTDLWYSLSLSNEWIESGFFYKAEKQLFLTLKHHPRNFHVLSQLGKLSQKCQRLDEAVSYYKQAAEQHENPIETNLKIVQVLMSFNEIERASANLLQLLKQYPNHFNIPKQLGLLERKKENSEAAIDWFYKAKILATKAEDIKDIKLLIIEEQKSLGKLEDAYKNLDAFLEQYPNDITGQILLGSILQKKLDFVAASKIYEKIIANSPENIQARIELAQILSQSDKTSQATELLANTHKTLGPNLQVLMRLGQLEMALEHWETAHGWYGEACKLYPLSPQPYTALASVMMLQGDSDQSLTLLQQARLQMPHAVEIPLKTAHIYQQLGHVTQGIQELIVSRERFPYHVPLHLLLTRLYIDVGDFTKAQGVLESIKSNRAIWKREIERIRGELAINNYDYQKAETHFKNTLTYLPSPNEHNRLAAILAMSGRLDEASTQLKLSTELLAMQSSPGKANIPLISHSAKVIRSFRTNPFFLEQLLEAQIETGEERMLALAQIVTQEPTYLGAASILTKELRHQGTFSQLLSVLPGTQSNCLSIPRRIIQYWDTSKPPKDVQRLCQSWAEVNPDYEYRRFSRQDAIAFIKQHYKGDGRVLTAFQNCDEPATQSDFFRLAYLNKMGGFYADADDGCRKSLDVILGLNPELVLIQEPLAHIGNNFIGCIPGQPTVRVAFYRAIERLLNYSGETPWFKTGPGLMTCALASTLLPYIADIDYRLWPRLWVLSQAELRQIVTPHVSLPYKRTEKSWSYRAYQRTSSSIKKMSKI